MSIYIDISEFVSHPHRTGIQRVTGELCQRWPAGCEAIPVTVTNDGRLVTLPAEIFDTIGEYFRADASEIAEHETVLRRMAAEAETHSPEVRLQTADVLLCTEVFYNPVRIYSYESRPPALHSCYRFIVYDLLPLTAPEYFVPDAPHHVLGRYFRLIRNVDKLAFISAATQREYSTRLRRCEDLAGRVIRLGSDGLGPRPVMPELPARKRFVVVGTIEPRKNHLLVLSAFERLLTANRDLELIFVGSIGWIDDRAKGQLNKARQAYPGFRIVEHASDATVRDLVQSARATIYVSAAEGFGLPPVESLWLGTPVIGSHTVPSLEPAYGGTDILQSFESAELAALVARYLDDGYHAHKRFEAANAVLPTWDSFAEEIADWITEEVAHAAR